MLDDLGFVWELPTDARKRRKKDDMIDDLEYPGLAASLASSEKRLSAAEELLEGWNSDGDSKDQAKKKINSLSLPGRMVGDYRSAVSYEPTRMFEPISYREVAAEAMREYLSSREYSSDPDVRNTAHFEGHLSPQEYHGVITRAIEPETIGKL